MKNELAFERDSNNIYANFKLNANKIGKIVLSILVALLFIIPIGLFSNIDIKGVKEVLPVLIFFIAVITFSVRFLLWNLYGEEFITINPKSISYSRTYGFFNTTLTSINFNQMAVYIQEINMKDLDEPIGKLAFSDIDKTTRLEEIKFETTILVPTRKLKGLIELISIQQQDELNESKGFGGFSQN